jgi:steroid 5-alpha reductase family enzyme
MIDITTIFIRSALAIAILLVLVWLESVRRKDASIIDLVWGIGFVSVAWTAYFSVVAKTGEYGSTQLILPLLTTVWGLRLSVYLAWRNHGQPEDYRYREMRESWGKSFPIVNLFTVFGLQGVIMWVVSLPLQVGIAAADENILWLLVVGILLWATGLIFEAVGDWQLARFKSQPENEGKVLSSGLWRYTRHPNYFGDFLVWWSFFLIAFSQCGVWWIVVSPIVMSIFLMKVSGVTLLEKSLKEKRPDYANYIRQTNAFFPGPPSSDK